MAEKLVENRVAHCYLNAVAAGFVVAPLFRVNQCRENGRLAKSPPAFVEAYQKFRPGLPYPAQTQCAWYGETAVAPLPRPAASTQFR